MAETEQNEKTTDYNDFNRQLIEEFRANGGKVSGMFAGAPLLLLTTTGAKSGQPRVAPLAYTTDNGRLVVIASKGGAPTHPDWFHNVRANPEVTVEVGTETFPARATIPTEQNDSDSSTRWRRRCRTSRSTSATPRVSSPSSSSSAPARPHRALPPEQGLARGKSSSPARTGATGLATGNAALLTPSGTAVIALHRFTRWHRDPASARLLRRLAASTLARDAPTAALR